MHGRTRPRWSQPPPEPRGAPSSLRKAHPRRARWNRFQALLGGMGALLGGAPAAFAAPPEPGDAATLDEKAQLAAAAGGYGALTGLWVHELTGRRHWASAVLPGAGMGALAVGSVAWLDAQDGWRLGQPQALVTDASIGTTIAGLWIWHQNARHPSDPWSPEVRSTLLWSGATAGAALGALRYAWSPSPPGRAAFTGSVAWWCGALSGLLTGALTDDPEQRESRASLAAAIGTEAGLVLGAWLGRTARPPGGWSVRWVRAVDAGALLGSVALGGGFVLASGRPAEDPATLGFAAGGLVLGGAAAMTLAPWLLSTGGRWSVAPAVTPSSQGLRLMTSF